MSKILRDPVVIIKSILLDQNAKQWTFKVNPPFLMLRPKIDEKTQNIKIYYSEAEEGLNEQETVTIFDFGTNQKVDEGVDLWELFYLDSLSQHEGHIVHHLFWDLD